MKNEKLPDKAYQKELEALDAIVPGHVMVFSMGEDFSAGVWDELVSITAMPEARSAPWWTG